MTRRGEEEGYWKLRKVAVSSAEDMERELRER